MTGEELSVKCLLSLAIWFRLTFNSFFSCLSLLSARVTGVLLHAGEAIFQPSESLSTSPAPIAFSLYTVSQPLCPIGAMGLFSSPLLQLVFFLELPVF